MRYRLPGIVALSMLALAGIACVEKGDPDVAANDGGGGRTQTAAPPAPPTFDDVEPKDGKSNPDTCKVRTMGPCPTTPEFSDGPTVPSARDFHGATVVDVGERAFLYVLGGYDDQSAPLRDVQRATLDGQGMAGFEKVGELDDFLVDPAVATVGRTIVVAGGLSSSLERATPHVMLTQVQDDGSLAPWSDGPDLPVGVYYSAMAVLGASVFVVGGADENNTAVAGVYRATVNDDGTLSPWETLASLPSPRAHHAAAFVGRTLVVTGGRRVVLDGNSPMKDVVTAVVDEQENVGAWTAQADLPMWLYGHGLATNGGDLYVVGGVKDHIPSDEVWRASVSDDGTVGVWEPRMPLPEPRANARQTPTYDDQVFLVGGTSHAADVANGTFIGRFHDHAAQEG